MDMNDDIFAGMTFGKIALQKIAPVEPTFRLYKAGWLGKGDTREVMEVTGALFREALSGPNKGQLSIMVPRTQRTTYVTAQEMTAFEAASPSKQQQSNRPG